ncbi:N-acetyltransferase [uncultured Tateyamaria sp.]|uniref:GNAT family N-acetyltransferase n=1 Tax=uncultured Tateyamaria sp. TaxID=455651 RepID=UPI00261BA138|nr:N-acetyltransferase [uncultured Tateyamaria sp.]
MIIRDERPEEINAIYDLTQTAFAPMSYSDGSEGGIIDALRADNALTLSLVAIEGDEIIGHVAFSQVMVDGQDGPWFGLGPVAVAPAHQCQGVGSALIRTGLERLKGMDAACVFLLGNPDYYARFGFQAVETLWYGDRPSPYFQRLVLSGAEPRGQVVFHTAFECS